VSSLHGYWTRPWLRGAGWFAIPWNPASVSLAGFIIAQIDAFG
jgi:hypothetical protein